MRRVYGLGARVCVQGFGFNLDESLGCWNDILAFRAPATVTGSSDV